MNLLPLLLSLGLAPASPPDDTATSGLVLVDGGDVSIVVPGMTASVANVLAPELAADGGLTHDGGVARVIAPASLSVYTVSVPAETALTVGFFGLYFMTDIVIKPTLAADSTCLNRSSTGKCDPATLSPFDRYAVGRQSAAWSTFSDIALAASLAIPLLYLGLESLTLPTDQPFFDFLGDSLVIAESVALTASLETVFKFAFRRPRPINYVSAPVAGSTIDSQLSMPSGHTSVVSAATMALTTTVFLRHPESQIRYVVLSAGIALSLLTGFARVQAGQHFPTDVITSLLMGSAAGFAVPYFHRKTPRITPSVAFLPDTGTAVFALSGAL